MSEDIQMMMEREAGMPDACPMLGVGFFVRPVQHAGQSKIAGHPVFMDREWVKIVIPGDKNGTVETTVQDTHKRRFPKAYAAFKQREGAPSVVGFAIEEWPQVTRAQALTLKAMHVPTVEALAEVSDANIDKIGHGGRDLRAKAQAFIAVSNDTAAASAIKAENEKLMAMLKDQQRQINEMSAKLQKTGKAAMQIGPLETRIA